MRFESGVGSGGWLVVVEGACERVWRGCAYARWSMAKSHRNMMLLTSLLGLKMIWTLDEKRVLTTNPLALASVAMGEAPLTMSESTLSSRLRRAERQAGRQTE